MMRTIRGPIERHATEPYYMAKYALPAGHVLTVRINAVILDDEYGHYCGYCGIGLVEREFGAHRCLNVPENDIQPAVIIPAPVRPRIILCSVAQNDHVAFPLDGSPCTAMAASACVFFRKEGLPGLERNTERKFMGILRNGYEHYHKVVRAQPLLTIKEVCDYPFDFVTRRRSGLIQSKTYNIVAPEDGSLALQLHGCLIGTRDGLIQLEQALEYFFRSEQYSYAVLTTANQSMALAKTGRNIIYVDSHPCRQDGFRAFDENGRACAMVFTNDANRAAEEIANFVKCLSLSHNRKETVFAIDPIIISNNDDVTEARSNLGRPGSFVFHRATEQQIQPVFSTVLFSCNLLLCLWNTEEDELIRITQKKLACYAAVFFVSGIRMEMPVEVLDLLKGIKNASCAPVEDLPGMFHFLRNPAGDHYQEYTALATQLIRLDNYYVVGADKEIEQRDKSETCIEVVREFLRADASKRPLAAVVTSMSPDCDNALAISRIWNSKEKEEDVYVFLPMKMHYLLLEDNKGVERNSSVWKLKSSDEGLDVLLKNLICRQLRVDTVGMGYNSDGNFDLERYKRAENYLLRFETFQVQGLNEMEIGD